MEPDFSFLILIIIIFWACAKARVPSPFYAVDPFGLLVKLMDPFSDKVLNASIKWTGYNKEVTYIFKNTIVDKDLVMLLY